MKRILILVIVIAWTPLAFGQTSLSQLIFPDIHASVQEGKAPAPRAPHLVGGVRAGGFAITDEDADEFYGGLIQYGADARLHIWKLPLAVQAGFDYAFGSGDSDDYPGAEGIDAEGDIVFQAYRLSVLLAPPPGLFGSSGFYVTPYVGGGLGYHILSVDITGDTPVGQLDESVTQTSEGYHALAGIDFVFGSLISVGLEVLWTTVKVEDPLENELDFGGLSAALTLRVHLW